MSKSSENTKDIDAVDADGWTALHYAALNGDASEVERLLAAGANVDADNVKHGFLRTRLHSSLHRNTIQPLRCYADRCSVVGRTLTRVITKGMEAKTLLRFQ